MKPRASSREYRPAGPSSSGRTAERCPGTEALAALARLLGRQAAREWLSPPAGEIDEAARGAPRRPNNGDGR
jgi:hypothetical protein